MTTTFEDLLARTKQTIREISVDEVRALLDGSSAPRLIDVREADEVAAGRLPGAAHIPRGFLESRIEKAADRGDKVILYCASGNRSALAARSLLELGYTDVSSMAGGFNRWHDRAFPVETKSGLSAQQLERYARHLTIPEVGEAGQRKLLEAKVLLLGAGGLGSPAALYLAAAGVGRLGIVDMDVVDLSNLQRQILHAQSRLGMPKTESAERAIRDLNPDVKVERFAEKLDRSNVLRILAGYDVIIDGGDNFPTRYLLNDACVMTRKPNIHGSVYRFEGQVTTFVPDRGPCYRCLYPTPPPVELAPGCAEAGVLGVVPGIIGLLQATECLKLILGVGEPLIGRLLTFDALGAAFTTLNLKRNASCPVCAPGIRVELIDYDQFCLTR